MLSPLRRYPKAVFDTSPLITALTLELLEHEPQSAVTILNRSPLQPYLMAEPARQEKFHDLLSRIGEIVITSHVIGEIKSSRFSGMLHEVYWHRGFEFFDRHHVREEFIAVAELRRDDALRRIAFELGPTDAGLVALARHENCILFTDDQLLYNWQGRGAFHGLEIQKVEYELSLW